MRTATQIRTALVAACASHDHDVRDIDARDVAESLTLAASYGSRVAGLIRLGCGADTAFGYARDAAHCAILAHAISADLYGSAALVLNV